VRVGRPRPAGRQPSLQQCHTSGGRFSVPQRRSNGGGRRIRSRRAEDVGPGTDGCSAALSKWRMDLDEKRARTPAPTMDNRSGTTKRGRRTAETTVTASLASFPSGAIWSSAVVTGPRAKRGRTRAHPKRESIFAKVEVSTIFNTYSGSSAVAGGRALTE